MSIPAPQTTPTQPIDPAAIRVGVVGLGRIGTHHADSLDDGVLVAGLDHSTGARAHFEETFGVQAFDPSDRAAFFDAVDAVIVCTPNKYHEEYATTALSAGKHVLLEKPLAHSLASAERIATVAAASDATCAVGFNNRFGTATQEAIVAITAGELGRITHIEANYLRTGGAPDGWFTDPEIAGGGALIDLGVHALDLALYLLGHPTVTHAVGVTHATNPTHRDRGIDDVAHAFVTTADWTTVAVNASWDAPVDHYDVTIHGTDEQLTFDLLDGTVDSYRDEQRAFLAAAMRGEPGDVETALTVQRAVSRIYGESMPTPDERMISIEIDTEPTPEVGD